MSLFSFEGGIRISKQANQKVKMNNLMAWDLLALKITTVIFELL
jgi:hypothetical protein